MAIDVRNWARRHGEAKSREEATRYRGMTPTQRLRIFLEINDLSWALFRANPRLQTALELRDELPESTRAHLRRLKRGYAWRPQ
jgi:hypothetical protein